MIEHAEQPVEKPRAAFAWSRIFRWLLLAAAGVFFALHFLHLNADFPNNSPWMDWAKYTDEGWYGDAAIRQVLFGHWYFKGDFNPAVALPTFPALELIAFRLFGVSAVVARAFTLCIFFVSLAAAWSLLERHTRQRTGHSGPPLAAAFALLMLCTSPYIYVLERMAILEPLLVCLTLLALLAADHLHAARLAAGAAGSTLFAAARRWLPAIALGLLLPAMVLTKTTAVFLIPAIAYMVWARAGYRLRPAVRLAVVPSVIAAALYVGYYALFVRRYIEDYRYLFSANAYTGIELERFDRVILHTVQDGAWMGAVLYPLFFVTLTLMVFWRPRLFANPVVPALLLWTGAVLCFPGVITTICSRGITWWSPFRSRCWWRWGSIVSGRRAGAWPASLQVRSLVCCCLRSSCQMPRSRLISYGTLRIRFARQRWRSRRSCARTTSTPI